MSIEKSAEGAYVEIADLERDSVGTVEMDGLNEGDTDLLGLAVGALDEEGSELGKEKTRGLRGQWRISKESLIQLDCIPPFLIPSIWFVFVSLLGRNASVVSVVCALSHDSTMRLLPQLIPRK
jgi:hypothetical protein